MRVVPRYSLPIAAECWRCQGIRGALAARGTGAHPGLGQHALLLFPLALQLFSCLLLLDLSLRIHPLRGEGDIERREREEGKERGPMERGRNKGKEGSRGAVESRVSDALFAKP